MLRKFSTRPISRKKIVMIKIYDTYTDSLEISKAQLRKWNYDYKALGKFTSLDFREQFINGLQCRVYLNGDDLVIESEVCDGVPAPGEAFDSKYEVMTVLVSDASKYRFVKSVY